MSDNATTENHEGENDERAQDRALLDMVVEHTDQLVRMTLPRTVITDMAADRAKLFAEMAGVPYEGQDINEVALSVTDPVVYGRAYRAVMDLALRQSPLHLASIIRSAIGPDLFTAIEIMARENFRHILSARETSEEKSSEANEAGGDTEVVIIMPPHPTAC